MSVDLSRAVKMHDGSTLTIYEIVHQHDLMKRFILEMARGPYNTTKLGFYHRCEDSAAKLAKQLWPDTQEQSTK